MTRPNWQTAAENTALLATLPISVLIAFAIVLIVNAGSIVLLPIVCCAESARNGIESLARTVGRPSRRPSTSSER